MDPAARLSRRRLLQAAAGASGAAVALGAGWQIWERASESGDDGSGWFPYGTLVARPSGGPEEQTLWATLMRVDDKIDADDAWYLWHWTHDASLCRLYSSPSATGPFRELTCRLPPVPVGYERWSAGDIAWEAPYFYAAPHAHADRTVPSARGHPTFLMRSSDGSNWTLISEEPIIAPGTISAFDSFAAGYGRFLRDLGGNLVRIDGDAVFFYRGERLVEGQSSYAVGAAGSRDLESWSKLSVGAPFFDPAGGALFGLGSALWNDDTEEASLVLSVARDSPTEWTMESKQADQPGSVTDWSDGPGTRLYEPPFPFADGGSVIAAGSGSAEYMVFAALRPDGHSVVELLQSA